MRDKVLDHAAINNAALSVLPALLRSWLPDGRVEGCEYIALNPTRADRRPGSFKINIRNCRWADFATADRGRGAVSLLAYLRNLTPTEASRQLSRMLELTDAA